MKLRRAKKILDRQSRRLINYRLLTFSKAAKRVDWPTYCFYAKRAVRGVAFPDVCERL